MRRLFLLFLVGLLPGLVRAEAAVSPGEILERSIAAFAKVNDYTCVLHRKERFNGAVKEQESIHFKFRKPGSYSMRWNGDMVERAVYVEGRNDNEMMIRATGVFNFIRLGVEPAMALKHGRHTIMDADIGHILGLFAQNYRKARGDRDAQVSYDGDETLDGRPTWRFKALLPEGRGYYGHRILVHIDQGLLLPVRIEVYGWQDEFLEMYAYSKLAVNVGLTAEDFDIRREE